MIITIEVYPQTISSFLLALDATLMSYDKSSRVTKIVVSEIEKSLLELAPAFVAQVPTGTIFGIPVYLKEKI